MKKRLVVPGLALTLASLTACNLSAGGYIMNGKPYKDGYAARINPVLRAEAEGSIKAVKISTKVTVSASISYSGRSSSGKATVTGDANVDLVNERINGKYVFKVSGSAASSGSETYNFIAERDGGSFYVTSGNYTSGLTGVSSLDALYEEASYNIYSWNFSYDSQQVTEMVEELQSELGSSVNVQTIYNKINSSLVYNGDFENGNAEIGFSKAVSFNISNVKVTYNKFKVVYKDCFIRSSDLGLKASASESGTKVTISLSYSNTYSYTKQFDSILKNSLALNQTIFCYLLSIFSAMPMNA